MVKELGTEVITGEYTQSDQSPEEVEATLKEAWETYRAKTDKLQAKAENSAAAAKKGIDLLAGKEDPVAVPEKCIAVNEAVNDTIN